MQPAQQVPGLDPLPEADHRFPHAVARRRDVVIEVRRVDQPGRLAALFANPDDVAVEQAVVPQHVLDAFVGMPRAVDVGRLAVAELPADRDLALRLGFVRKQPRGHVTRIHQDERCVEQPRNALDFRPLRRVGNGMKRRAEGKTSLHAPGVDIQHDVDLGKEVALHEVGDAVRDGPSRISRERAVHVHPVKRRHPKVGRAGPGTQLGDQDHPAAQRRGVEVMTEALDRNLAFVLVAVRAAESHDGRRESRCSAAAGPVDNGQRQQRVAPGAVQVERRLIVMLAWFFEIDLLWIMDNFWHGALSTMLGRSPAAKSQPAFLTTRRDEVRERAVRTRREPLGAHRCT